MTEEQRHVLAEALDQARLHMRRAFMEMSALADRCDAPELSVRMINTEFWDGNQAMNTLLAEMKDTPE